jgi:hypothetical protein
MLARSISTMLKILCGDTFYSHLDPIPLRRRETLDVQAVSP